MTTQKEPLFTDLGLLRASGFNDAADEIERLRKALKEKSCLPDSIQEALNSGDGTYRP